MKIAIVTTTINVPVFFSGYCEDAKAHNHAGVQFIVIGDKKTPPEVGEYCNGLQEKYGYSFEYYGVEEQIEYLKKFPELEEYLPYNSVQRRNIGMIRAYELGADTILTVDDDNFILEKDLLKYHLMVGRKTVLPSYNSDSLWFDPCQFLVEKRGIPFYHRGFPLEQRWKEKPVVTQKDAEGRIIVNVGLWHGDPDVDAWSRLAFPLETVKWDKEENFVLTRNTWSPFNSQQTTLAKDVLPAYFLNPNAGRYDDIWASYILHRISNHFEDLVSYGHPIVLHEQKRSLKSLMRDFDDERIGIQLTTPFTEALRSIQLAGKTYEECYSELINGLQVWIAATEFTVPNAKEYLKEYVRGMEMWQKTIQRVVDA